MDEETRKNMEAAWEAEDDKDECIVNLEGPLSATTGWEARQGCWGVIGSAEWCLRGMGRIIKEEWGREQL